MLMTFYSFNLRLIAVTVLVVTIVSTRGYASAAASPIVRTVLAPERQTDAADLLTSQIIIKYRAAAIAVGANNGGLTFWIDDVQQSNLTGVDNDTRRIDQVRLGAVSGVDDGTRGIYFFDAFEPRRSIYIGPQHR